MSVTIEANPDVYTPSDNPIVWRFSSDQTAQPNFSYIVEIYVDGTLDSSHQIFPEVGIYAHFDASEKMTAKVPAPVIGQTTVTTDAVNNREIYIKVFERYGTPASNQASDTSITITAFKASLSPEDMAVWVSTNYSAGSITRKFFTELADNIAIRTGADYYLSIISREQSNLTAVLTFKDSAGATVTTYSEAISNTIKIVQLMINLDKLVDDATITQAEADDTATVEVQIISSGSFEWSEIKTFTIDRNCGYRGRHLIWLNHLGGFDQFNFFHNAIETGSTKTKKYKKQFGNWSGNEFILDAYNAGELEYLVTTEPSIELVSDWLSQDVQNWLVQSLFDGVLVNMQTGLTTYSRVSKESNSFRLNNDFFDDLFNVTMKLKLSNSRNSPRI